MSLERYRVTLGAYAFSCLPITGAKSSAVIREGVSPNVRVAVLWTWSMRCQVLASTDAEGTVPPAAATDLGTFLTSAVHDRVLPASLSIVDQAGAAIPVIGDVSVAGGWEDLQLTEFDLDSSSDAPGQLVAGAWFSLTLKARKSLPDANGICELDLEYETTSDDQGREVRRVSGTIRLGLAAYSSPTNARITDAAIVAAAGIKLAQPTGWVRSRGNNSNGFDIRYPLYPRLISGVVVSEVTKNGGVAGATGAKSADVGVRNKDDPKKGVIRKTTTADTTGPDAGAAIAWVLDQQPPQSTGETLDEPSKKHARGEWETVEVLTAAAIEAGKVTRVRRRYTLRGGDRSVKASPKASGLRPKIVRGGPFSAWLLLETIEVQAMGAVTLKDVPLPRPLADPWLLDGESLVDALPVVDEDANYPEQRIWLRVGERQYLFAGAGDPLEERQVEPRVMSDGTNNIAVIEVGT